MDFKEIADKNKILEIRVGSHLFGTDTPDSDLDLFGIFMPSEKLVYGFQHCEEVDLGYVAKDDTGRNTKEAVDFKLHEYRKFIRLALQNNPNILHVLFVNEKNIRFIDEFGRSLLDNYKLFPHKGAHHRFVQYADSQRHKMMIKPQNYAELERGLEILENSDDHKVMAEFKEAPPFKYEGTGKHVKIGDLNFEAGVYAKTARKKIKDRLENATSRHVLFTKYGYDVKFSSNLIQLLKEGVELMETGRIEFPLKFASDILDIKKGKYSVSEILEWADQLVEEARVAYEKSSLPTEPRHKEVEAFLISEVKRFFISK